jgi:chemotaxis signal transduction protein
VDSASEVLKIPADDVEAPPAVFQDGGLNCVTGLGKVKGRLVVLLDMSKLLAPGSLQISAATGEAKAVAKEAKATPKVEARGASAR